MNGKRLARLAGVFYLLTIVTGSLALVSVRGRPAANLVATLWYVAVVLLFFRLFEPVSRGLSTLAALFGLAGCAVGALGALRVSFPINSLAFFGVYCLLIGILIVGSTFLPRALGVFMAIGGLGWLTFAVPSFAKNVLPYNMLPGILAETALTVWLLAAGVDERRWKAQAGGTT